MWYFSVGLAHVNGRAYAMGGWDGANYLRTVDRYEPNLNKWFSAQDMETVRSSHGVAVLNNYIYAVRVPWEIL